MVSRWHLTKCFLLLGNIQSKNRHKVRNIYILNPRGLMNPVNKYALQARLWLSKLGVDISIGWA